MWRLSSKTVKSINRIDDVYIGLYRAQYFRLWAFKLMSETFSLAHLVTTIFPLVDAFVTLASVVKFLLLRPSWSAEGGLPFAHVLICFRKYFLVPYGVLAMSKVFFIKRLSTTLTENPPPLLPLASLAVRLSGCRTPPPTSYRCCKIAMRAWPSS